MPPCGIPSLQCPYSPPTRGVSAVHLKNEVARRLWMPIDHVGSHKARGCPKSARMLSRPIPASVNARQDGYDTAVDSGISINTNSLHVYQCRRGLYSSSIFSFRDATALVLTISLSPSLGVLTPLPSRWWNQRSKKSSSSTWRPLWTGGRSAKRQPR